MKVEVTQAQKTELDALGFFVTPILFDDATLVAVRNAFHDAWQALIEDMDSKGVENSGIVNARIRPFLANIRASQPACREYCRHPIFADLCLQTLGPDVDITWDQAVIKPPHTDSAFGWHQDMWYAENGDYLNGADMERVRRNDTSITVWAAISDTTIANGTLEVLPKVHANGLLPHRWDEETSDWRGEYDTSDGIPVEMEAGQAIVFRRYVPHASGGNQTDGARLAYQIGYSLPGVLSDDSPHTEPFLRDGERC